jgi:adenylate kinase
MLGAPGAGKGTQAQILASKFSIPKLSTGDILRQAVEKKDEVSKKLKQIMDAGNLVPDNVVINIIASRLQEKDCQTGFILDGFPRTKAQAIALDKILDDYGINNVVVINLDVDVEELVRRISGRFNCKHCGASYNKFSKMPVIEGVCDQCGSSEFQHRADDNEIAVRKRLDIYSQQTEPLKEFYEKKGNLRSINGKQPIERITDEIANAIDCDDNFTRKKEVYYT